MIRDDRPEGVKRKADGPGDEARDELVRGDDRGRGEKSSLGSPSSAPSGKSPRGPVQNISKKRGRGEAALEAMSRDDGRLRSMQVVREHLGCQNDLGDVYSVPRVARMAAAMGMVQGFSLDLTQPLAGYTGDLGKRECRERALASVRRLRPYMLIGSPECRTCP